MISNFPPIKMRRCTDLFRALSASVLLVSIFSIQAQADVMTLQDSVRIALERNFDIQISEKTKERAEQDVVIAKADFLPEVSINGLNRFSKQSNSGSVLDGASQPQSDVEDSEIQITQKLNSGATATFTTSMNRRETNSSNNRTLNPAYNTDAALRISQPILSGFGPDVAKAQRRLSKLALERRELEFQATVLNIINNTEAAYHQVVFAKEQLIVRQSAKDLAERLYEENKAKEETGIATGLDVLQAQVGLANAQDRLIRAQQAVANAEDNLANLIGIDQVDTSLEVEELQIGEITAPKVEATYLKAMEHQPRYLTLLNVIEQRSVELRRAKRNRLPSLNLNGTFAITALDASLRDSLETLPEGDSYNWNMNMSLDVPWGLQQKKANYSKAQLQLESEELRVAKEKSLIMRNTRSTVRSVNTAIESISIKELATRLSEEEYEMQKARFDEGLSTGRRVLEAQQRMNEAKVDDLRAKIDLLNAYSNLREIDGSSLLRYGIEFGAE